MMLCFHSVHGKRKCFYFQEIIKYLYKNRQISEISLLSSNLSKADVLRLLNVVFIDYDIDQIYPYSPSFQPVFLRYRQETVWIGTYKAGQPLYLKQDFYSLSKPLAIWC